MIGNIRLLHYLNEATYVKICDRLGLDSSYSRIGDNFIEYDNAPITKIHMFNIDYNTFGRIWFMHVDIDYTLFECGYEEFPNVLYGKYKTLFGEEALSDFPLYDHINCDYIEYTSSLKFDNADYVIEKLKTGKCVPEQLDKSMWSSYQKANSTISFYICKQDDTHIQVLAKCHGTALKRRIKDTSVHRATGITPCVAINAETERKIIEWQLSLYFTPVGL
jgi:hypothetical protein